MDLNKINKLLGSVKAKLESVDLAQLESQKSALEQHPKKLDGARKRLANLYGKLTKGRSDDNEVKAYGAER